MMFTKRVLSFLRNATFVHGTEGSAVSPSAYRPEIDGLRAIAVLAVILFHFGLLPSGYLGVDVFFVISGYLITGIISREIDRGTFSVWNFYLRRTRRILPLACVVSAVALAFGTAVMLPDDLENLAQSVVASNFFANNLLQAVTTRNYWDVVNEYKPMMHTWSLGIEEQYYLLYPPLLLLARGDSRRRLIVILGVISLVSYALYLAPFEDYLKFYLLPFRFFELAVGGVTALVMRDRLLRSRFAPVLLLGLVALLCFDLPLLPSEGTLTCVVVLTASLLAMNSQVSRLNSFVLQNPVMLGAGKVSFSLYMWHQVVLAYARYFLVPETQPQHLALIFVCTLVLSVGTYFLIESPFRRESFIGTRSLLLALAAIYVVTTTTALFVVREAGVIRDVPELGLQAGRAKSGVHSAFNHRIRDFDRDFKSSSKTRVLVVGNSFAKDWANVLLSSRFGNDIDLSYLSDPENDVETFRRRANEAQVIFLSTPTPEFVKGLRVEEAKLYVVGTKNFGVSNGIFYNYSGPDYYKQRTAVDPVFHMENAVAKRLWKGRYVDYFEKVADEKGRVPVFTPEGRFISADCRHLTEAGANYFASLFETDLTTIFSNLRR